ncbi:MAG: hypothetical protein JWQ24_4932 [Tardiphaga sp.]|nr:hypothetical protein [Tardiphaga sp.]
MPDESARVGVAFDAVIFDEPYCALDWFTETVLRVRSDGNDRTAQARFVSELNHEFVGTCQVASGHMLFGLKTVIVLKLNALVTPSGRLQIRIPGRVRRVLDHVPVQVR